MIFFLFFWIEANLWVDWSTFDSQLANIELCDKYL